MEAEPLVVPVSVPVTPSIYAVTLKHSGHTIYLRLIDTGSEVANPAGGGEHVIWEKLADGSLKLLRHDNFATNPTTLIKVGNKFRKAEVKEVDAWTYANIYESDSKKTNKNPEIIKEFPGVQTLIDAIQYYIHLLTLPQKRYFGIFRQIYYKEIQEHYAYLKASLEKAILVLPVLEAHPELADNLIGDQANGFETYKEALENILKAFDEIEDLTEVVGRRNKDQAWYSRIFSSCFPNEAQYKKIDEARRLLGKAQSQIYYRYHSKVDVQTQDHYGLPKTNKAMNDELGFKGSVEVSQRYLGHNGLGTYQVFEEKQTVDVNVSRDYWKEWGRKGIVFAITIGLASFIYDHTNYALFSIGFPSYEYYVEYKKENPDSDLSIFDTSNAIAGIFSIVSSVYIYPIFDFVTGFFWKKERLIVKNKSIEPIGEPVERPEIPERMGPLFKLAEMTLGSVGATAICRALDKNLPSHLNTEAIKNAMRVPRITDNENIDLLEHAKRLADAISNLLNTVPGSARGTGKITDPDCPQYLKNFYEGSKVVTLEQFKELAKSICGKGSVSEEDHDPSKLLIDAKALAEALAKLLGAGLQASDRQNLNKIIANQDPSVAKNFIRAIGNVLDHDELNNALLLAAAKEVCDKIRDLVERVRPVPASIPGRAIVSDVSSRSLISTPTMPVLTGIVASVPKIFSSLDGKNFSENESEDAAAQYAERAKKIQSRLEAFEAYLNTDPNFKETYKWYINNINKVLTSETVNLDDLSKALDKLEQEIKKVNAGVRSRGGILDWFRANRGAEGFSLLEEGEKRRTTYGTTRKRD